MNRITILKIMTALLLLTATANAQRRKGRTDTLTVYREFAALGQWYLQQPVQMKIHMGYRSTPAKTAQDSVETDLQVYYGKNDFYLQAEGMEQIANDSLIVMVNNETKMINLYPNNGESFKKFQEAMALLAPDSSLQKLAQQYVAGINEEKQGGNKITLQSRNRVSGTDLVKEVVSITFDAATHQPLAYYHMNRSLVPVDSVTYNRLAENSAYAGRLISTKVNEYNVFLVVKELITDCRFTNIGHGQQAPPAREHNRVLRGENGEYLAAKGFEHYLVTTEW
jgi:hypothetical protein